MSTVTFLAGDSTAELLVATVDDAVVEDAATVTTLVRADTASQPRYVTGSPNRATVTVRDNDAASFAVSAGADAVVEGTEVTVTVATGGVTFAQAQTPVGECDGQRHPRRRFRVDRLQRR